MAEQTKKSALSHQSPTAIRIVVPEIDVILSIGCGEKMGWGNDCNTRHLCYRCQAILREFPPHILIEVIQRLENFTRTKLVTTK